MIGFEGGAFDRVPMGRGSSPLFSPADDAEGKSWRCSVASFGGEGIAIDLRDASVLNIECCTRSKTPSCRILSNIIYMFLYNNNFQIRG